jgi:hypothetical protein
VLSRSEQKQLAKKIGQLLWTDWDPIGCGVPEDEYDMYVPEILGLLLHGTDRHRLAEHLYKLETINMGLGGGNMEHDTRTAELLLHLMPPSNGFASGCS